jgi:hypothetical protein
LAVFSERYSQYGLKIAYKVTAIVPCTENSVSSKSFLFQVMLLRQWSFDKIDTDAEDVWFWLMEYLCYAKNYNQLLIFHVTLRHSSGGTLTMNIHKQCDSFKTITSGD